MKTILINENYTSNYTKNLLKSRGITDIDNFLNPTEKNLQSWKDLDNIEKGIKIIDNLTEKSRICIIIDSDTDGFTSAAIIGQYLKRLIPSLNFHYFIHEGKQHGFEDCWKLLLDNEYDLIIAPDSASNDKEFIKNFKCPVLVLDHHIVEDLDFPSNMIVINNQISHKYKNKFLSGAGVVYQFCRALDDFFNLAWADDYIDLVALGEIGDMMSALELENQFLWRKGLSNIKNYFFSTLIKKQSYSIAKKVNPTEEELIESLTPLSISFYIVPLINAMIRVGSYDEKLRLLNSFIDGHKLIPSQKRGSKGKLEEIAIESVRECINARTHQNKIKDEFIKKLEQKILKQGLLENKVLFVRLDEEDNFPSELNGLTAMTLSQKYKRPTIVARLNNEGYVRGSARGLNNSELSSFKDFLNSSEMFEYTLGHDQAFGISLLNSNLNKFHQYANKELANFNFGENFYEVDFERNAYAEDIKDIIIDLSLYNNIWSTNNDEPLIYINNIVLDKSDIQIIGKNHDTLKFEANGVVYIKFFAKEMIEQIQNYNNFKLEIIGKTNVNEWMGKYSPQIFINDYEIKENNIYEF